MLRSLFILSVRVYRLILSPMKQALLGPEARCRFSPSCSEYALEAMRLHGATQGGFLTVKRICRCHPWGGCGWDPVPKTELCGVTIVQSRSEANL
jgi:putative membrane protein insertion efficiency factor